MAEQLPQPSNDNRADVPGDSAAPWDDRVQSLRALVKILKESGLSELELEQEGIRLSLKLSGPNRKGHPAQSPAVVWVPDDLVFADTDPSAPEDELVPDAGLVPVFSPMVGIFYRKPSPNDPSFVEIGDRVEIGQTVGLVETMKVFNEIISEVEGTVVSISATDLSLVETGDILLSVRSSRG